MTPLNARGERMLIDMPREMFPALDAAAARFREDYEAAHPDTQALARGMDADRRDILAALDAAFAEAFAPYDALLATAREKSNG